MTRPSLALVVQTLCATPVLAEIGMIAATVSAACCSRTGPSEQHSPHGVARWKKVMEDGVDSELIFLKGGPATGDWRGSCRGGGMRHMSDGN